MTDRPHRAVIDYDRLGAHLQALAVPTRILLLHKLQVPQTATEIRLPPARRSRTGSPDRAVARQTVEAHLKRLEDAGLVRGRPSTRDGQPVREFLVNQPRLFTVVDELRRLMLIRPSAADAAFTGATGPFTQSADARGIRPGLPEGPALVLVSGPLEGKAFALSGPGPWTLGRRRDADVSLEYDPFVSSENTRVVRDAAGFVVEALPLARNGTSLNWTPLSRGERARLRPGDALGVGRSLLVFRA